jgi:ubiquinone/menaquinone biosynthesis C-methylase UbiE
MLTKTDLLSGFPANGANRLANSSVRIARMNDIPLRGGSEVRTAVCARRKGFYGIDAPFLLPVFGVFVLVNILEGWHSNTLWPFLVAAFLLACASFGLYASLRGKFVIWAGLINGLELKGDEQILDLGCGRGAVLLMAAEQLAAGRAVGVDIWRKQDQSGNTVEATRRNAVAEGVADRIELRTANMADLPFDDDSFDVVVSSLAIHNIKSRAGRDRAIDEAIRVLRPGGRLVIVDIFATGQYLARLTDRSMASVARRGLGMRLWWGGPWVPTHLVTATKPTVT